ncbi:hypothetical protein D3C78_1779160 [compost metagenome]
MHGQAARDGDALALAAGKLVRVLGQCLARQPDVFQPVAGQLQPLLCIAADAVQ